MTGLRDNQGQAWDWQERTYHPGRLVGILVLIMVVVLAVSMSVLLSLPHRSYSPSDKEAILPLLAVMLLICVPAAVLALYMLTWTLTIGPDRITSRSLFTRKTVPLNQIDSIIIRDVPTKNGSINTTTVEGVGQKITFSATMPDYALVRDYLQARAGESAVERGAAAVPTMEKKQLRETMIVATVVSLFGFGGLFLYFQHTALQRLEVQDRLDTRGIRVIGHVDGTHTTGSKSTTYLIDYDFTANGLTYHHSSPVTRADYDAAQPQQPISIRYLPDDPSISRAQQSIGRQDAESMLHVSYWILLFAVATPPLCYVSLKQQFRKQRKADP